MRFYAVFACLRGANRALDPPCLDPLSYGRGNEPKQEYLLRRGRVQLFDTKAEAETCLAVSSQRMHDCDPETFKTFRKKFSFLILECEA